MSRTSFETDRILLVLPGMNTFIVQRTHCTNDGHNVERNDGMDPAYLAHRG
jgi:hypothetical protein